jgi:hypothetical protein
MPACEIVGMQKSVLAVLAIVLVAGCVGQTTTPTTGGPGLAITSFTADVTEQTSTRDIRLFAEFENQGESKVLMSKSLVALIGPIGDGLLQWGVVPNNVSTFRRDLNPADVARDLPAGRDTKQWKVKAPSLDPGQSKTDTFTVRTYYDYEVKGIGNIVTYSEAEATAVQEQGDTLETGFFSTTRGPVELSIRSVPDPVIALGEETVTLEITISNVGGGTVYRAGQEVFTSDMTDVPGLDFSDLNKVNLMVDTALEETGTTCKTGAEQELIGGKPTTITCDFKVKVPANKQSYPVRVNATYGYYTEQSIQLTAVGRR